MQQGIMGDAKYMICACDRLSLFKCGIVLLSLALLGVPAALPLIVMSGHVNPKGTPPSLLQVSRV